MKRILMTLAISSSMVMSAAQFAHATTVADPLASLVLSGASTTKKGQTTFESDLLTVGEFTSALTSLYSSLGYTNLVSDLAAYAKGEGANFDSALINHAENDWSATLTFNGSAKTIAVDGATLVGGNLISTPPQTIGAPGPVAGAGVPVILGLVGFAAFRRRKVTAAV